MAYKTVLFDLDGTLLDTIGMIVESLAHALHVHVGRAPAEAVLRRSVGSPLDEMMHEQLEAAGHASSAALIEAMSASYREHNLAIHDQRVRAFEGADRLLSGLHASGRQIAIVTSKPNGTARRGLKVTGLAHHFDVVVGCDDVGNTKPHPEPVLTALEALGARPEGALFVGDSPHDMGAGRAAGVHTAAAGWGPFDAASLRPYTPTLRPGSLSHLGELLGL